MKITTINLSLSAIAALAFTASKGFADAPAASSDSANATPSQELKNECEEVKSEPEAPASESCLESLLKAGIGEDDSPNTERHPVCIGGE